MLDGDDFEARSAALLESAGLCIVARQYRCRLGEIDLVAVDGERVIFVEVRARSRRSHGGAAASVDRRKQCKLARCAAFFLSQHPQWSHLPCRFDVIAWEATPATPPGGVQTRLMGAGSALTEPRARIARTRPPPPSGTRENMQAHWLKAAFLI